MKKISILLLCLFVCGCSNKSIMEKTEEISDVILSLHNNESYNKKGLDHEEIKLIDNFINDQKMENKVVNISDLSLFPNESITDQKQSAKVYKKNGEYFIKYSDLDFVYREDMDLTFASLVVEKYDVNIAKDIVPLLYYDTADDVNYTYRYMKREKKNNEINYYYRSYGNGSMLTINYEIEKNKIINIKLIYNNYYKEK